MFFIGVDNRTGKLVNVLSMVNMPADKGRKGSARIRMYDYEYLMTYEEPKMLKYMDAEIHLGHEDDDFLVRFKKGGKEDV